MPPSAPVSDAVTQPPFISPGLTVAQAQAIAQLRALNETDAQIAAALQLPISAVTEVPF